MTKEKIREVFIIHKKAIIIGLIILLVIIVTITALIINGKNKEKDVNLSHEEQLTKYLEDIGRNWYSDWYDDIKAYKKDDTKEYLSKHSSYENCIKVDLENLFRSDSEAKEKYKDEFINDQTKEVCNMTETKVTICPKDPYEKEDYDIEVKLDCGY